jgi:hypothetical protein
VDECARRADDAVGLRLESRQLLGQRTGDALDAADLAPCSGPRVDYDVPNLIG